MTDVRTKVNITLLLMRWLNLTDKDIPPAKPELYQVPPSMALFLFIAYGTICVVSMIGNSLVLWLVLPTKRMWSVTNLFLVNLAVADIIISIFTIPFQFQAALLQKWDLPEFLCPLCPFVQALSVLVSVLTLSAIAVQRYKAVMYPFSRPTSKEKAIRVILIIWLISALLALPTYLDYNVTYFKNIFRRPPITSYCRTTYLSEVFRWYYSQALVMTQYFLPLLTITATYARMGCHLWRLEMPGNQEQVRDAIFEKKKRKAAKMMTGVVAMFAFCWCPYQVYNFLLIHFPEINDYPYINLIWFGIHWLAMSNSCCNPFIYAIYNDKFQTEFRQRSSSSGGMLVRLCGNRPVVGNNAELFELGPVAAVQV